MKKNLKKRTVIEGGGRGNDKGKRGKGNDKDNSDDAQLKKGLENTIL
jgi:hypothetical protein